MKAMRFLLKLSGWVLLALGAACLIAGFYEQIAEMLPGKRKHSEFDDYAD